MRYRLLTLTVIAVLIGGLAATLGTTNTEASDHGRIASGFGIVPGQNLVVHVTVAVGTGQSNRAAVEAALAGLGARPLTSEEFSLTGLVHDGPADGVSGNDTVDVVYYPTNTEGIDLGSVVSKSVFPWNDVGASALILNVAGTTSNACPSLLKECPGSQFLNGANEVAFYALSGSTTLAVAWSHSGTDEFDITFNTNYDWVDSTSPSSGLFDIVTVGIHEFGHGAGIGHSDVSGSVMEPTYAGVRRDLHQDDIDALVTLYGTGTTDPPPEETPPPEVGTVEIDGLGEDVGGAPTFSNRSRVSFTVQVLDAGDQPLAGATVTATVEAPNGKVRAGSGTTDANGNVTFSYRVNTRRDGTGLHTVTATSDGQQDIEYFDSVQ